MSVLNLRKGLGGWVLQRISAVFLALYILPLLVFWLMHPQLTRDMTWRAFLLSIEMRVLGVFAAVALVVHASIGVWVVATDYVHIVSVRNLLLALFYLITLLSGVIIFYLLIGS